MKRVTNFSTVNDSRQVILQVTYLLTMNNLEQT